MSSMLDRKAVLYGIDAADKNDVLYRMAEALKEAGKIEDVDAFYKDVQAREQIAPTAIGFDMGLPHGKTDNVMEAGIAFAKMSSPVVWNPETGEEAKVAIMLAVPEQEAGNTHLDLLAKLSRRLIHEDFRNELLNSDADRAYDLLTETLEEK